MNETESERVLRISKTIRDTMTELLDTYGNEIATLSEHDDPHTPGIAWLQFNMLQACAEYLIEQGVKPSDALMLTVGTASESAKKWFVAVKDAKPNPYQLNRRE